VRGEDIYTFCRLTGDTNKAHEGDQAALPAFYINWLVKRAYDSQNSAYHFSKLSNNFRKVIRRDEPFIISQLDSVKTDGAIEHRFEIQKDSEVVADGTVEYRENLDPFQPTRFETRGDANLGHQRTYPLTNEQVNAVSETIGLGSNYSGARLATIVSRTSHALLNLPSRELFETPDGREKHPYFGSHKLQVHDGLEQALEAKDFTLHVRPDQKKSRVQQVYIRGTAGERPIFDLAVTIFYFDSNPT
jgi:hypothetical protein